MLRSRGGFAIRRVLLWILGVAVIAITSVATDRVIQKRQVEAAARRDSAHKDSLRRAVVKAQLDSNLARARAQAESDQLSREVRALIPQLLAELDSGQKAEARSKAAEKPPQPKKRSTAKPKVAVRADSAKKGSCYGPKEVCGTP